MQPATGKYYSPVLLKASPLLDISGGSLELGEWDLFDLYPCKLASGKKQSAKKPTLSDQGP